MFNDDLCLGLFCFFLSLTLMTLSSYHRARTNKKTLLLLRSMAAGGYKEMSSILADQ